MIPNLLTLKRIILSLILLSFFHSYGNLIPPSTNYFISGNYKEFGININYSAVINTQLITNNFNDKKQLSMQLSSFLIEDAKFQNRIYRDNDIFGISFPIDTAVEITTEIQLLFGNKFINKTIVLHPNKKTILDINTNKTNFSETQLNTKKTLSIKALYNHETFIDDIRASIEQNTKRKDPEAIEEEYTRLMILGNSYLNENNYVQAVAVYQYAKKYSADISYAESQINTTAKYAENNNVIIDTKYKQQNTVSKDYYTKKQPSIHSKKIPEKNLTKISNNKKTQIKYSKNEDGSEYEYENSPGANNESVYTVNYDDSDAEYEYEHEYKKPNSPLKQMTTIFDKQDSEYEYEYDDVQTTNSNVSDIEYESENGKPLYVQNNQPSLNNSINSQQTQVTANVKVESPVKTKNSGVKRIISNKTPENTIAAIGVKKPSNENFEVIRTKKGYIKYRKDEQAVVDSEGNIMIPYGKHEIIRFRAGFARVKIKDDVEIKNVVCINKNEEYTWSARIYENPWKETVMGKDGRFVDKIIKKVEIYIVDNVNNIPNSELSPGLLKKYKDPNPFRGTDQISAFNLWNRKNGNTPSVVQKRAEIERLKQISKNEAFLGAEECRKKVSINFEEVFNYYQKMGYEIILKD